MAQGKELLFVLGKWNSFYTKNYTSVYECIHTHMYKITALYNCNFTVGISCKKNMGSLIPWDWHWENNILKKTIIKYTVWSYCGKTSVGMEETITGCKRFT